MDKAFRFAVVPLEAGNIELPDISFYILDPELGQIRETKLTLGRLNVAQGEAEATPLAGSGASATTTQKTSVNIQGDDILPNSPTFSTLARHNHLNLGAALVWTLDTCLSGSGCRLADPPPRRRIQ